MTGTWFYGSMAVYSAEQLNIKRYTVLVDLHRSLDCYLWDAAVRPSSRWETYFNPPHALAVLTAYGGWKEVGR